MKVGHVRAVCVCAWPMDKAVADVAISPHKSMFIRCSDCFSNWYGAAGHAPAVARHAAAGDDFIVTLVEKTRTIFYIFMYANGFDWYVL